MSKACLAIDGSQTKVVLGFAQSGLAHPVFFTDPAIFEVLGEILSEFTALVRILIIDLRLVLVNVGI
jgi:hypothetical protein